SGPPAIANGNDHIWGVHHRLQHGPDDELLVADERCDPYRIDIDEGVGKDVSTRTAAQSEPGAPPLPHRAWDRHPFAIKTLATSPVDYDEHVVVAIGVNHGRACDDRGLTAAHRAFPQSRNRRCPQAEGALRQNDEPRAGIDLGFSLGNQVALTSDPG